MCRPLVIAGAVFFIIFITGTRRFSSKHRGVYHTRERSYIDIKSVPPVATEPTLMGLAGAGIALTTGDGTAVYIKVLWILGNGIALVGGEKGAISSLL
jgi:hypothetical protein